MRPLHVVRDRVAHDHRRESGWRTRHGYVVTSPECSKAVSGPSFQLASLGKVRMRNYVTTHHQSPSVTPRAFRLPFDGAVRANTRGRRRRQLCAEQQLTKVAPGLPVARYVRSAGGRPGSHPPFSSTHPRNPTAIPSRQATAHAQSHVEFVRDVQNRNFVMFQVTSPSARRIPRVIGIESFS